MAYQCISNFETVATIIEAGETYVQVGFVDLSIDLWSDLRDKKNKNSEKPAKIYHIDMNIICVARSMVIHQMLLQSLNSQTIFEVWYSSCLSEQSI